MSRDWCWTSFDTDSEINFDKDNVRYICYGREKCATTGKQHLQGFAIFNRTCRIPKCKQWLGSDRLHVEPRRGSREQARDYCRKDGDFWEWGRYESMTTTELFKQPINYLKENYPEFYCRYHRGLEKLHVDTGEKWRDVHVTWLWGKSGTGKTRRVMEMDDVYKLDGTMKWWDGYQGESILLLDDVDDSDFFNRRFMLNILDGYRLRLEIKGSFTFAKWTAVFITSNWSPLSFLRKDPAFARRCDVVTELG